MLALRDVSTQNAWNRRSDGISGSIRRISVRSPTTIQPSGSVRASRSTDSSCLDPLLGTDPRCVIYRNRRHRIRFESGRVAMRSGHIPGPPPAQGKIRIEPAGVHELCSYARSCVLPTPVLTACRTSSQVASYPFASVCLDSPTIGALPSERPNPSVKRPYVDTRSFRQTVEFRGEGLQACAQDPRGPSGSASSSPTGSPCCGTTML